MKKSVYYLLILLLIIPATLFLQAHFLDKRYGAHNPNPECLWCEEGESGEDVAFIPFDTAVMRLIAPADSHFLADLLWMRTTYYFGQHALTDQQYPFLLHLLDLITDLSPSWELPYIFGAVVFPLELEELEGGLYLIEKGLIYQPDNWQLWFYKGYFLWKSREDLISAAKALNKASLLPGSPKYLARLSATLATRAGQKELAVRFLEEALRGAKDLSKQKILREKLKEVISSGYDSTSIE